MHSYVLCIERQSNSIVNCYNFKATQNYISIFQNYEYIFNFQGLPFYIASAETCMFA